MACIARPSRNGWAIRFKGPFQGGWRLAREAQHGGVVAEFRRPADQRVPARLVGGCLARQKPQVFAGRLADDRPGVVIGVVHDPVVADEERTEERDLELGVAGAGDDPRPPRHRAQRAVHTAVAARVRHADEAVRAPRILGRRGLAAPLEAGVVAGHLVPSAGIAIEVDRLGRLRHGPVAARAAGRASDEEAGCADQQERRQQGHGA